MNFIYVWNEIQANGGATYNMDTRELNPPTGFIVALQGYEKKTALPTNLNEFQDALTSYLTHEILAVLQGQETLYLGFWVKGDILYIDVCERIDNRDAAIVAGYNRHQIAIYDATEKQVITL